LNACRVWHDAQVPRLTRSAAAAAVCLAALAASPAAGGAASAEHVKIVVSPSSLSRSAAANPGFAVTVSGDSSVHAFQALNYQLVRSMPCAASAGAEMTRKGASQLEPVPATPGHPQRFPSNPANFIGPFDWHGVVVVFSGTAGPGSYRVCGYLGAAAATSLAKPISTASAVFTVR